MPDVSDDRRERECVRQLRGEAVKRFAKQSTKASAALERRTVPVGYVRSTRVKKLLAERQSKA